MLEGFWLVVVCWKFKLSIEQGSHLKKKPNDEKKRNGRVVECVWESVKQHFLISFSGCDEDKEGL